MRSSTLQPEDRVLVRNLSERGGPEKLRSFWESDIYIVVERKGPNSPVYEAESESKGQKNRVLHRNLLLPCNYLPIENSQPDTERPTPPTTWRLGKPEPSYPALENDDTSSDDKHEDLVAVLPPRNPPPPQITPDRLPETEENEVLPEENEVLPENNEVHREHHNEQVEHMNVDNGDQVNGEHHDDNLNPQPEMYRAPRPRRIRHPPDRLTYYGPGEAMPTELFQISVPPQGPNGNPYYLLSSGLLSSLQHTRTHSHYLITLQHTHTNYNHLIT